MQDGKPEFVYAFSNQPEHKFRVRSDQRVPAGNHLVRIAFPLPGMSLRAAGDIDHELNLLQLDDLLVVFEIRWLNDSMAPSNGSSAACSCGLSCRAFSAFRCADCSRAAALRRTPLVLAPC